MNFKDKSLEEKFKNVSVDDLVKIIDSITVDRFKCPVCSKSSFAFIVDSQNNTVLSPFCTPVMDDENIDEHSIHYKMCCNTCAHEVNFNAFLVLKRLEVLKNES